MRDLQFQFEAILGRGQFQFQSTTFYFYCFFLLHSLYILIAFIFFVLLCSMLRSFTAVAAPVYITISTCGLCIFCIDSFGRGVQELVAVGAEAGEVGTGELGRGVGVGGIEHGVIDYGGFFPPF